MNEGAPLFVFRDGAIRFLKPVVVPGMVVRIKSLRLTGTANLTDTLQLPSFWAPYTMFRRADALKLTLSSPLRQVGTFDYRATKAADHTHAHSEPIPSNQCVLTLHPLRTAVGGATSLVFSIEGLDLGKTAYLEVEFLV